MTQEEKELDKLAEKYQDDNTIIRYYGPGNGSVPEYNKTMAEVFKDGWNACKKQMIDKVVEGMITNAGGEFEYDVATFRFDGNHTYSVLLPHEEKRKYGDKVRIIIVKEDEK